MLKLFLFCASVHGDRMGLKRTAKLSLSNSRHATHLSCSQFCDQQELYPGTTNDVISDVGC